MNNIGQKREWHIIIQLTQNQVKSVMTLLLKWVAPIPFLPLTYISPSMAFSHLDKYLNAYEIPYPKTNN